MAGPGHPALAVSFRRAGETDASAEHQVFLAAEGELLQRHGFGWATPPPPDRIASTLRHLLAHDAERCFVAEADGRVVGYGAAFVRGGTTFLAALFIDPLVQGRGVGQGLLERVLTGTPSRRLTISDAIQPVSNAIYARWGMLPVTPILGFGGQATRVPAPEVEAAEPEARALATIDAAAYGFDRAIDHAFWATQAAGTLWLNGGAPVAYSYRWPSGRIGPIAGLEPRWAAAALVAELTRRADGYVEIPGTSRVLVRVAFDAGLRLEAPPGLLLVSDEVEAPRSLAISSYGLM